MEMVAILPSRYGNLHFIQSWLATENIYATSVMYYTIWPKRIRIRASFRVYGHGKRSQLRPSFFEYAPQFAIPHSDLALFGRSLCPFFFPLATEHCRLPWSIVERRCIVEQSHLRRCHNECTNKYSGKPIKMSAGQQNMKNVDSCACSTQIHIINKSVSLLVRISIWNIRL